MLDAEAKWVERELEDKLIHSTNELKETLAELRGKVSLTEAGLQKTLAKLPDRERLALKSMLARDVFHVAVLYETFLRSSPLIHNTPTVDIDIPQEIDPKDQAATVLVFKESLFE
jgi:hypothetical protein